ncbi:heptaprenyl diphosphate synthase component 1 [Brevibacillus sp. WF146]|jgi:heptaprenyl diphosphate synthase|uniref:heptaprenyl diphosphate synthase component 1 n=1 Tax=Brevibacillus sp. WF146 TaxID=319501 RepID=UPI0007ED2F6D|nr:heptaprenyl diphosphate synthase component 1 [Brevibacillus sp. WF146]UYZ11770.1 heptaprenyl diphosphate synthase component 1 [Brevibacillus sp. WF146]
MSKEQTPYVDEVRAIIDQIYQSITHSFVEQYVDVPAIAENRLALLYLFLLERGMTKERARTFSMSTGLVQLGLDMHERVKNAYDNSLAAERSRQLTVLAGDYYSSRYYQMLAEAGEMEAIQVLSDAIQRVNEAKMTLYMAERDGRLSSDEYLTLRTEIDTGLYVAIVDKYADSEETRRFWTALFEETAAVENMLGEWEQLKWQQQVPFGFSRFLLQKPGATIAQVAAALEAKAMELMSICEQLVRSLHPPETRHVLTWITSRYSHRVNRLKRVIEEM